jgi:hypothetical protein
LALAKSLLLLLDVKPIAHLAVTVGVVAGLVGCGVDTDGADYAEGLGTPESPLPREGAYAVVSRLHIALEMPAIDLALANLRAFSQNPAHGILTGPAGMTLAAALPSSLRSGLEGWMNTEIDKARIGTKTIRQYATDVAAIAQTVLADFTIESSLTISPSSAVHSFSNLNFTAANLDIIVPIGGLTADALVQKPTVEVGTGGSLALGAQRFGLGFGAHAWQGINLASTTLYGSDLSVLAGTIDCRTIAQTLAAKCISGACVGHAPELTELCGSAVTSLIDDLRSQIAPVNVEVMLFSHGRARLVDTDGDGIANQIVEGTWDTQTDVGHGLTAATGTFVALGK